MLLSMQLAYQSSSVKVLNMPDLGESLNRLPWRGVGLWGEETKCEAELLCSVPRAAPLRPYLSGVPEDLLEEWAYLRNQVFPDLDLLCQARGTRFSPVSVQWLDAKHEPVSQNQDTCTTSHISPLAAQQLKIRLDVINQSDFFMCVLGQRYGGCPSQGCLMPFPASATVSQEEVEQELEENLYVAGRRGGYPWLLEMTHATSSLTELEITQACQSPHTRCLFYFRTSEDEEGTESEEGQGRRATLRSILSSVSPQERGRMMGLKKRIAEACWPVRFFRSVEELGVLVRGDWEAIIEELYPTLEARPGDAPRDPEGVLERQLHEFHLQSLSKHFLASPQAMAVMNTINTFVSPVVCLARQEKKDPCRSVEISRNEKNSVIQDSQSEKAIILLAGERGCGKSTLVSHWLHGFRRRHPEVLVVSHVCGLSVGSRDILSLLRRTVRELRQAHESLPEWAECLDEWQEPWPLPRLTQALTAAMGLRPTLLLLDGLDQLTASHTLPTQAVKELHWLPTSLPPQCKLIMTTTSSDLTYKSLIRRSDVHVITWPGLTPDPTLRRDILLHHLSLTAREPAAALLQSIMGRSGLSHLPLFLSVLGNELKTTGVQREREEEEELLEEYAEMDSIVQLWRRVIQRWINDYYYTPPLEGAAASPSPMPIASSPQVCKTELRGWVWDCLCLLHLSRAGLTEQQLMALLEVLGHSGSLRVLPLEWALFRSATHHWICEDPAGQLTFTHQSLGQAVDLLLGLRAELGPDGQRRTKRGFHRTLASFFLRPREGLCGWTRVLEERPWHLEQMEAWGELHACLTDPQAVEHLSLSVTESPLSQRSYQLRADVLRYWAALKLRGYDLSTSHSTLLPRRHLTALNQSEAWSHPVMPHAEGAILSCDTVAVEDAKNGTFITDSHTGESLVDHPSAGEDSSLMSLRRLTQTLSFPGEEAHSQHSQHAAERARARKRARARAGVFLSELLMSVGRLEEAERGLLEAETLLGQAAGQDGASGGLLLKAQHALAELYAHTHQHHAAEAYCRRALHTTHTLSSAQDSHLQTHGRAQLLCSLAALQLQGNHPNEAADTLRQLTAVNHPKAHPAAVATVTLLRALHRLSVGGHGEAEHGVRVALASRRRWYGPQHPLVGDAEERLADLLTQTHRDQGEATELYRHVTGIRDRETKLHPVTSKLTQAAVCDLTVTLVKLGCLLLQDYSSVKMREGRNMLERAADLSLRLLGPTHTLTTHVHELLQSDISEADLSALSIRTLTLARAHTPQHTHNTHTHNQMPLTGKPSALNTPTH